MSIGSGTLEVGTLVCQKARGAKLNIQFRDFVEASLHIISSKFLRGVIVSDSLVELARRSLASRSMYLVISPSAAL